MSLLEKIKSPADLKKLGSEEMEALAAEIRDRVIEVTSVNGGHIGPNLGVVELTIALHKTFKSPEDRFIFDVSHQGYIHKLLTGRNTPAFENLRQTGGVSGFLCRDESEHDAFGAGHAGTALSAALGMAAARDQLGKDNHVVAVLGDAAFTCGITMEALNNISETTSRLIIILNDNEWSIAKNVGALARYFNQIITGPVYNKIDRGLVAFLKKVPGGSWILDVGKRWKRETKDFFVGSSLFEAYGLRYIGPIDGHDLDAVSKHLEFAKQQEQPIILHLLTKKGKGYEPAIASPEKFHGLGPFDKATGMAPKKKKEAPPNYQDVFGKRLLEFARNNPKIIGITAAMPPGTGLSHLRDSLPGQFFDVGIAEEHAVLFAAGMACEGMRPVVAIYSTFLQRAYDPIIHDVCLQNLPVTFCMDRAGLSPNDGPTHHGLFDIAYLRCIPNTIIMQPKDEDELADMLWTSLQADGPTFIRYPRGSGMGVLPKPSPQQLSIGRAVPVRDGKDIQFWALGPWVAEAEALAESIEAETSLSIGVVNARFAKPLDLDLLKIHARNSQLIVTFEDHAVTGGFGSAVMEAAHEIEGSCPVSLIGFPDNFVSHGSSVEDLRAAAGLSREALLERLRTLTSPLPKRRQIRLDFWKKWLSPDCPYPEDREERLKPDRELPGWALDALPGSPEETIILDVNAGPASTLGTRAHGRPIKLIAIDDLGNILDRVAGENNIHPPVPTVQCSAEDIQLRFGRQAFDLIYSCNGLDYTEDPISTYQQLYECLKPGGKIITFHEAAKDENQILLEGFRSFHELRDGEVFIRNLFSSKKLTSLIPSAKIKASEENGFIRVEIKMVSSRTWDMPLPELPSKESGLPSLISVHIPKTAGTSFGTFLENLYGKTFRPMYKPEEWDSDNYDLASLALEPGIRCLHGHFQATAYDKHLRDSMKVIWLRDPVERIVSSYLQYSRELGMERESTFNRRLFLEGWSLLDFARNKRICRQTEWYFDTMALSDFHFVGICEEFDASMKLFCHLLNIDVPKEVGAVNLNPNKKLGSKYSLPDAQYNQLAVILKEEIQLYRAACQRFNQQYHEAFGAQAPELATR